MKRFGFVALAVAMAFAPTVSSAESLSDALVSAYRSSGLLEQQRALLRAKDEDLAVAVAATRPALSYALSQKWSNTITSAGTSTSSASTSATLSASMTLYDFGRTALSVDLANENVLMARDALVGAEQNVLLRAVQAFLNVRSAHETALLQANNVRLLTQELRAARDRFDVGEITQTDVSLAEAALAAAKSAEAAARGQLMIAREEYLAAVGHYPNGLQVPPRTPVTANSLSAAKAVARGHHPDILSAQRAVTVADLATEISRRSMLPTASASASLTGTINSGTSVDTSTTAVGVTISGPIYMGGKLSALYRKAKAQAQASRAGLNLSVMGVEQSVANAWAQLAVAQASLQASDQQIRARRVALRGAKEEASLGARTTLDVLNFEQDLLNAETSRISAQSNEYLAVYSLLAAMGLLTADHLGLGVVAYDPDVYHNAVKDAPVRDVSPQGEKLDALLATLGRTNP